ncbi:glycosyltransferase [Aliihoeflea aestuarii]|uniref:glycosyltransferase n=1 Tax=Aliihoeflea aestuarii TaxID=453840 RepID=UPI002094F082|nr:glycosyltransferase [Aliihoeflea aestuarii]
MSMNISPADVTAATGQIGIVVIGRNEGQRLVDCLASILGKGKTTIYVDSGSTDGSVATAVRMGATVVIMERGSQFSAARARNLGFRQLMHEAPETSFVQFLDGDCQLQPDWISAAATFLTRNPKVALVCGRRRERWPERTVYNALCDQEWNGPLGEIDECGGDFLARVDAFRQVGGFNDGLIAGEEPELCIRLRERGWRIFRIAEEMTRHDADILHFSQWWRRTVRGGHAFAQIEAMHRASPQRLWRRNVFRAFFWGGLAPALLALAPIAGGWALLGLLAYPLQWARLVFRRRDFSRFGLASAGLLVIGKLAELQGIATFHLSALRRRDPLLIEYK